ncbi:MAG TPA: alpha/beta fold hydrolase [Polyangiaceae bacterium]|nr:alpha/beta fold hydrolase [Polyangiaceae bacterium]
MTLPAHHSFASIEGLRLHWLEVGSGRERAPLVLLHGLNDSHLTWKRAASALATSRRVLMPDLPGYGLSDRPNASYELDWHARVTAKWLERIGLDEVDVVGHSFGGGVAQGILFQRPAKIRRLVLVAPGGLGRQVTLALRLASMPRVVERFGQPFMAIGTRLALLGNRGQFSKQEIDELCAMNGAPGSARAFARTVRDVIDWRGQRRAFAHRAHEIDELPPIAVYWGECDAIIPAAHGSAFAEVVEGVVLRRFANCGHYLHHEQPEEFARAVLEFLDAPSAPAARIRRIHRAVARSPTYHRRWKQITRW